MASMHAQLFSCRTEFCHRYSNNRNSVLNADFEKLEAGTEVRFAEEEGARGPQASTVKVVGKHHVVD